ncbi:MAG: hypothetical protein QXL27_09495 [Candidatus Bathyarchaeia archaeon]
MEMGYMGCCPWPITLNRIVIKLDVVHETVLRALRVVHFLGGVWFE